MKVLNKAFVFLCLLNTLWASAPSVTSKPVLSVDQNSKYTYTLEATDSDGDNLTWKVKDGTSLPSWLKLEGNNTWESVGSLGFTEGSVNYTNIVLDSNNIPYVAYRDNSQSQKASVKRYNKSNNTWEIVGSLGFTEGSVDYTNIVLDSNNIPYVAYRDNSQSQKASVKRYNKSNNTWEIVGSLGFTEGSAFYTKIVLDSNDTPYVVYRDTSESDKASVKRYNSSNNTWVSVGSLGFSAGRAGYTDIVLDSNNVPYVVYSDGSELYKASVKKYNSSNNTWETVGSLGFTEGNALYINIVLDSNDTPYVVYQDGSESNKASVKRYNSLNNTWEAVGNLGFSAGQADYTNIVLDSNNVPYVVYRDGSEENKASVKRYNSSNNTWKTVGSLGFSEDSAFYTNIVLDSNNVPYVVYKDSSQSSKASVKRFNTSRLSGTPSESDVGEHNISLIVSDGTNETEHNFKLTVNSLKPSVKSKPVLSVDEKSKYTYTLEATDAQGDKLTWKIKDGTTLPSWLTLDSKSNWESVGSLGFSEDSAFDTNIAIDSNNVPYVVYKDGSQSYKASVKKYNSSSNKWESLGNLGFSEGSVTYPKIALDSNDTPYVAYRDTSESFKASVKRYNSSNNTWETVGKLGFSAGQADYTNIVLDSNNVPYVVYVDRSKLGKVSVKKYNSSTKAWETIGSLGFTQGRASDTNIVIDSNNVPYVVYQDSSKSFKASVMKYNSLAEDWEIVGKLGLSDDSISHPNIALDSNNIPYVVYSDNSESYKASVKKYNSSTKAWETVGKLGFTQGLAYNINMVLDSNNTPYIVYADGSQSYKANVKKYDSLTKTWETVGGLNFTQGSAYSTDIVIDSNDVPYVVYKDGSQSNKASVKKLNNSIILSGTPSESDVGEHNISLIVSDGVNETEHNFKLTVNSLKPIVKSKPILSVDEKSKYTYILEAQDAQGDSLTWRVKDGTTLPSWLTLDSKKSWENVGSLGFSEGKADYTNIALDSNNTPYVVYQDEENSDKASVKRYNSSNNTWGNVGNLGFSDGRVSYTNIALDSNNIPYVVYQDNLESGKVSVKKYNSLNSIWETVGNLGFSEETASYTNIALDSNNTPYVVYQDGSQSNKASVKKYNSLNNTWESVGDLGFTDGSANYTNIVLDSNNLPYIVYQDGSQGDNASVKKYNSSNNTWETVGELGFSVREAYDTKIVLDSNNIPYVIYHDGENYKINVKKYNRGNNTWETLGNLVSLEGQAYYPNIALDSNNIPYIAYHDGSKSGRASVKKYNGLTKDWETVGELGFSGKRIEYPNIVLDSNDIPYVVYSDGSVSDKANVKKFNNSTILSGTPSESDVGEHNISLIVSDGTNETEHNLKLTVNSLKPIVKSKPVLSVDEKSKYTYTLEAQDAQGDSLTWKVKDGTTLPSWLTLNPKSTWDNVGSLGFTQGQAYYTDIAIDSNNVLYVVYSDASQSHKASVKKYNNSTKVWERVGELGFTEEYATYTKIVLDSNNTPYVVYRDGSQSDKLSVKKYNNSAKAWENLGNLGISDGSAFYINIALDSNNTPYVVYADNSVSNKASVKKYDRENSTWETVGSLGFSDGEVNDIRIALDSNNVPYVVYKDKSQSSKASVKKYLNGTWETVGRLGFTEDEASYTNIALDSNNVPYVVYTDRSKLNKVSVKKYNSSTKAWEAVGSLGLTQGMGISPSIVLDSNNTLYVVYRDFSHANKASVNRYNSSTKLWETVGSLGFSDGIANDINIALDSNNIPYVVYRDESVSSKASVKKFNNSELNGTPNESDVGEYNISLIVSDGVNETEQSFKITVKPIAPSVTSKPVLSVEQNSKYTYTLEAQDAQGDNLIWKVKDGTTLPSWLKLDSKSSWENLGSLGFSQGSAFATSIVLDSNNVPYVVYSDSSQSYKASVKKYNSSIKAWETVGSLGFTQGQASFTNIVLDSNNVPYVVYQDRINSNKASVKKYLNSTWETVGNLGFSAGEANYTNIVLDSNNTPYVVYRDVANSFKASVKKYNRENNTWETVGSLGFSAGRANYTNIVFDSNNVPYVVYQDGSKSDKASVKKYLNGTWETVGSLGFTEGSAGSTNIVLDSNNIPYVIYYDGSKSGKASVKKYNSSNSTWETLGSLGFTEYIASYTNIVLDSNNTPYVVYQDQSQSYKASVKRYNSSTKVWETVGNLGFSDGQANYTNIVLDSNNTPFVVYQDNSKSRKASVKKFKGNTLSGTPSQADVGEHNISLIVSDGVNETEQSFKIIVNNVNDNPTITIDSTLSTSEDGAKDLTFSFDDVDGDTVIATLKTDGKNGNVTINGTTIKYTPKANFNGKDSFVITLSDGNGYTTDKTINVNVSSVNDEPTITIDSTLSTSEDGAKDLTFSFDDVDGDTVTATLKTDGKNGNVTINGTTIKYTPKANFNGKDSFVITLSDGNGYTRDKTINVNVSSVNDEPIITIDSTLSTSEDGAKDLTFSFNDIDGDTVTATQKTAPKNGTIKITGTTIKYTPKANYNGKDNFVITLSDGNGYSIDKIVNVNISAVDDAPVITTSFENKKEEEDGKGFTLDLKISDIDSDINSPKAKYEVRTSNDTLVKVRVINGKLIVSPKKNASGKVRIYIKTVVNGLESEEKYFDYEIEDVNDAPKVSNIADISHEQSSNEITNTIKFNIWDDKSITSLIINSSNENLLPNTNISIKKLSEDKGQLTYKIDENNAGLTTVLVTAKDKEGLEYKESFAISVKATNDALCVENTKTALVFDLIKNANSFQDSVSTSLNLINSIESICNSKITWKSSDEEIVNNNDGSVSQGDKSKTIELLANIVKGDFSSQKSFLITVPKTNITDLDALKKLTFNMIKEENRSKYKVISSLDLISSILGKDITWESSDENTISPYSGYVTRSSSQDKKVTLTARIGGKQKVFNLKVLKLETLDTNIVQKDKDLLTYDSILGKNKDKNHIVYNLVKPLPLKAENGSTISWESSNPNYITTDGDVFRDENKDKYVTLTATITKDDLVETKEFEFLVLQNKIKENSKNKFKNASVENKQIKVITTKDAEEIETTSTISDELLDIVENIVSQESIQSIAQFVDKVVNVYLNNDGTSQTTMSNTKGVASLNNEINGANTQVNLDEDGNGDITSSANTSNGSIKLKLESDGSVSHEVISKNQKSSAKSTIASSEVISDDQGTVQTSSELKKGSILFKAVVTTKSNGETKTKFVRINTLTGEETDVANTLEENSSYPLGNEVEISELNGDLYIKTTTPVNGEIEIK